jgi:type VI secretion system secreted protein Hcp
MMAVAFMTAKGQKQGNIAGNVTEKGREGTIALFAVSYEIETPYDPQSGHASGKRQHKPVTITKAIDQASPKLLQALVTNETLTTVKIEFWRPAPETAGPYFVIALTNALIVDYALTSSADEDPPAFEQLEYEEFEMTYQKIEVTWVQGGVTASDDWNAPV